MDWSRLLRGSAPCAGCDGGREGTGTTSTFATDLATATERLQPVPHHGRTKIVGGERDGRLPHTSGNERDGQVFTMEFHGGRRWHVYGEGADRVVIPFAEPGPKAGDGGADAPTPVAVAATPAHVMLVVSLVVTLRMRS